MAQGTAALSGFEDRVAKCVELQKVERDITRVKMSLRLTFAPRVLAGLGCSHSLFGS